ncbi:hypothetical protein LguiA_015330 [Lonicera macranthoides]
MVGASKEIEALSTRGRSNGKGSIANDLVRLQKSPASAGSPENVLRVMDGLEEFSLEPLQWVLENIALIACCTIIILDHVPCNMVLMNEEGEMDLIKGQSHLHNYNSTPSESTTSIPPSPRLVISETWKKILKLATPERRCNKESNQDTIMYQAPATFDNIIHT